MGKFNFTTTNIPGLLIVDNFYAPDNRGAFAKFFNEEDFKDILPNFSIKESIVSFSHPNVLRGLHFQFEKPQSKLVTCLKGQVIDIAVDLRLHSPTFKQWTSVLLTEDNHKSFYLPEGFAHGYLALTECIFSYQCGEVFYAEGDSGIKYDDPDINVDWAQFCKNPADLIISEKDKTLMSFQEYQNHPYLFKYKEVYKK